MMGQLIVFVAAPKLDPIVSNKHVRRNDRQIISQKLDSNAKCHVSNLVDSMINFVLNNKVLLLNDCAI